MHFSSLPIEILASIAEESQKDDIKSLILVSKDFRDVARRLLWKEIRIQTIVKFDFVLNLFEKENHLGRGVKKLDLSFCEYTDWKGGEVSKLLNSISKDEFIRLIRTLPQLRILDISEPNFEEFTPEEFADQSLFPSVYDFTYYGGSNSSNNPIQTFLQLAPRVTKLNLSFNSYIGGWTKPLSICTPLKSLNCYAEEFLRGVDESFIHQASLINLEQLILNDDGRVRSSKTTAIINLIRRCSSTLRDITFYNDELYFEYDSIKSTLPILKNLITLNIKILNSPVDFLQHIPSKITTLGTFLLANQLEHLYSQPRPSLKLADISFDRWETGSVKFLPQSVVTLRFNCVVLEDDPGEESELELIYLEIRRYGRKNLQEIVITTIFEPSEQKEKDDLVRRFRWLGVNLDVWNWG